MRLYAKVMQSHCVYLAIKVHKSFLFFVSALWVDIVF